MLEAQARGLDEQAVKAVEPMERYELAIELLNDHTFASEAPDSYGESPLMGRLSQHI